MAHAQKPDFVFRRNERVYLNRRGRQFSRLLAGELCASVCRVCTARASLCSAVMWRLLVTHSILLFPLHFSSRASPCAVTFQMDSTTSWPCSKGLLQARCLQVWNHLMLRSDLVAVEGCCDPCVCSQVDPFICGRCTQIWFRRNIYIVLGIMDCVISASDWVQLFKII